MYKRVIDLLKSCYNLLHIDRLVEYFKSIPKQELIMDALVIAMSVVLGVVW